MGRLIHFDLSTVKRFLVLRFSFSFFSSLSLLSSLSLFSLLSFLSILSLSLSLSL